jgi:hypothetical protein
MSLQMTAQAQALRVASQGLTDHLQLHERKPVPLEKCINLYCAASTGEAPAANRLLIRLAELFASTRFNTQIIGTRIHPMNIGGVMSRTAMNMHPKNAIALNICPL